jgi:hypothetical protein
MATRVCVPHVHPTRHSANPNRKDPAMTALSDAELAVAEAKEQLVCFALGALPNEPGFEKAERAADALIAAVRHHDAEVVRALGLESMVGQYARDTIAALIEPAFPTDSYPEVEVRFADGPTVRVSRFEVTTDATTDSLVVEGLIATPGVRPPSGDVVRITYLGIPGRGAVADITARVDLFSRLTVSHIRIGTTIQTEETR